jgi:hypothetical protein
MRTMKLYPIAVVLLALGPAMAEEPAPAMTWQDAIGELASERTRAETCVGVLKRNAGDDEAALEQGRTGYDTAKSEIDGVVAALAVALAQGDEPESFTTLETQLKRGVEGREAFCKAALALAPPQDGTKSAIFDVLGEVIGPLIEAAKEIYIFSEEQDVLVRETIRTQLEATKWPSFASIEP